MYPNSMMSSNIIFFGILVIIEINNYIRYDAVAAVKVRAVPAPSSGENVTDTH